MAKDNAVNFQTLTTPGQDAPNVVLEQSMSNERQKGQAEAVFHDAFEKREETKLQVPLT